MCVHWGYILALKFNLLILSRSLKAFEANIFFLFSQKNLAFCHLSVWPVSGTHNNVSTYYETAKGHKE